MNAKDLYRRVGKYAGDLGRGTKTFVKRYGADVLSILAGIGVVATGISAYNAGKNACTEDDGCSYRRTRTWKDVPTAPVSIGAATIGCIAGARYLGRKTEKELLAASAVLASYCAKQRGSGQNDVASGKSDSRGDSNSVKSDIEDTGTGDVIFIEDFTGRRFKASWECYEYAKRKLQENFSVAQCVTLNDFYGLLNLSETSAGEVLGWTIDQMIMDPYYAGEDLYYEDALTQLCIEEDTDEDGNVIIYYCVLPIGSLAGVGPCNY